MPYTAKLYQAPDFATYQQKKTNYLVSLEEGYLGKKIEEKWDFIFSKFELIVSPEQWIFWQAFKMERNNVSDDPSEIALQFCLNYFEDFYYLCCREDENFQLSDAERTKLLGQIQQAMNDDALGLNCGFEMILHQYKFEGDWLQNFLTKMRTDIFLELSSRCAEKVHCTLNVAFRAMLPYALFYKIGIPWEYASATHHSENEQIHAFYQTNFPRRFKAFESFLRKNVSEYLLKEIAERYGPVVETESAVKIESEIVIPADQMDAFNDFINTRRLKLEGVDVTKYLGCYDNQGLHFTLFPQSEVLTGLRELLILKFKKEGYFIDFEESTSARLAAETFPIMNLMCELQSENLMQLNQSFFTYNGTNAAALQKLMSEHFKILLLYPALFWKHAARHPELFKLLPKTVAINTYFLVVGEQEFGGILREAIDNNDVVALPQLLESLLYLQNKEIDYIHYLPLKVISNRNFALLLIEKDERFLAKLSESLKQDGEIIAAFNQLSFLQRKILKYVDPALLTQADQDTLNSLKESYKEILSVACFEPLLRTTLNAKYTQIAEFLLINAMRLNIEQVVNLAQFLTPKRFMQIINARKDMNRPPLPGSYEHRVMAYCWKNLSDDEGMYTLRREVEERIRFDKDPFRRENKDLSLTEKNKNDFLSLFAEQNLWLVAILQHRQNQLIETWPQLYAQLNMTITFLRKIIFLSVLIVIIFNCLCLLILLSNITNSLLYYSLIIFFYILSLFPPIAILGQKFLLHVSPLLPTNLPMFLSQLRFSFELTTLRLFLVGLTLSPYALEFLVAYIIVNLLQRELQEIANLLTSIHSLFLNIVSPFSRSTLFYKTCLEATVTDNCEVSIFRLQLIGSSSALQKAQILKNLWGQISNEVALLKENGDCDVEQELLLRLSKSYAIVYQDAEYSFSFRQVAAMARSSDNSQAFVMDTPKAGILSKLGFFNTSTTKFLPAEPEQSNLTLITC